MQFAPSPQGSLHIRSIADGAQSLDAFLVKEALSMTTPATPAEIEPRSTRMNRSPSAQAPTRTKRYAHSTPPPLPNGVQRDHTLQHPRPASRGVRTMTSSKLSRWRETRIETRSRDSGHIPSWCRSTLRGTHMANAWSGFTLIQVQPYPPRFSSMRGKNSCTRHTHASITQHLTYDLLRLMSRYPPMAKFLSPQGRSLKLANHFPCPLRQAIHFTF
jgi:hypothetical protein